LSFKSITSSLNWFRRLKTRSFWSPMKR